MLRPESRVALVTGASRGIGAAIAKRLAQEGAHVAITYRSSREDAQAVVAAVEAFGRRGLAVAADGRDPDAVERAVAETVSGLDGLDILVNNAGLFPFAPVAEASLEAFDETLAVNVRAAFVASKAALRHMREEGRIIMIGSNLAERTPAPGLSLYVASKAALIGLAKAMARDLGPRGITVNVVNPGPTNTDMNPEDGPRAEPQRSAMAITRFGKPEEIAGLVAWLAGPEARFVTGASLAIDGGVSI